MPGALTSLHWRSPPPSSPPPTKTPPHVLPPPAAAFTTPLGSHEFGTGTSGRKVYIQAGLHADEIPGLLVALTLRESLRVLDEAGRIQSRIVVLSMANPV